MMVFPPLNHIPPLGKNGNFLIEHTLKCHTKDINIKVYIKWKHGFYLIPVQWSCGYFICIYSFVV